MCINSYTFSIEHAFSTPSSYIGFASPGPRFESRLGRGTPVRAAVDFVHPLTGECAREFDREEPGPLEGGGI